MAAPPQTRQQRRREARRLKELGRTAVSRGLPADFDNEIPLGVALLLYEALTDAGSLRPASAAAALAEDVLDRSLAAIERDTAIACRRGCSHCCVTVASVTPPEVFRVAGWLVAEGSRLPEQLSVAAVLARCDAKAGASIAQMLSAKQPCPALVDHACGVHPSRPINCRQFFSTSLEACIARFGNDQGEIPFVTAAIDRGLLARILLLGAMRAAGRPDTSFELSGALRVALTLPDAERRWLAGEDVFQGVLVTPRPASTQSFVERTAALVAEYAG